MTREEVINAARAALEEATGSETSVCYLTSEDKEWLEMAIKALEQGDVLEKIKAEIEQEITYKPMEMRDYRMGLTKAIKIISKHT